MDKLEILTDFKEAVVEYIGGFVVRQVRKNLTCAICSSSLVCEENDIPAKLINTKDRGGLIRLSCNVKTVCVVAEQCLQHVKKVKDVPRTQANLIQALCSTVLRVTAEKHPYCFQELDEHDMDCPVMSNHKHVVIKCIAMSYLKVRLHHEAKSHSDKIQVYIYRYYPLTLSRFVNSLKKITKYIFISVERVLALKLRER